MEVSSESSDETASKFLYDLPSRGFLSSTVVSSNPGSLRVYVCEHDTSPSSESSSKDAKETSEDGPKKRAANRALDDRSSVKRAANASKQEGPSSNTGERDFQSMTVEKLRALLKKKGLPTKGTKDELIARMKKAN